MSNVLTVISEALKPYSNIIIAVFIFIIFISLSYYGYKNYYIPYSEKQVLADMANANGRTKIANIYFFYVDWCPHCKTAKPEWDTFMMRYNNTEKGGYMIQCYSINCTDDNGTILMNDINAIPENAEKEKPYDIKETPVKIADLIRKYNIDAYPTIKMLKDNTTIDYDAKITYDHLDKFVESTLLYI